MLSTERALVASSSARCVPHANISKPSVTPQPRFTRMSKGDGTRPCVRVNILANERMGADVHQPINTLSGQDRSKLSSSSQDIVLGFFKALNTRDIGAMSSFVSEDCVHQDLAHETAAVDRRGVVSFYQDLISSMADTMLFVIEDITGGNCHRVAVTWHLEVHGAEVPLTKGLSFYRIDSRGLICYVRQSPEHFIKIAGFALSAAGIASPLIGSLGPAAMPSFWSQLAGTAAGAFTGAFPAASIFCGGESAGVNNSAGQSFVQGYASAAAASGGSAFGSGNGMSYMMPSSPSAPPSSLGVPFGAPGVMHWADPSTTPGSGPFAGSTSTSSPHQQPTPSSMHAVSAELEALKRRIDVLGRSMMDLSSASLASEATDGEQASSLPPSPMTSDAPASSSMASASTIDVPSVATSATCRITDVHQAPHTTSAPHSSSPTTTTSGGQVGWQQQAGPAGQQQQGGQASGAACLTGVWARDMARSEQESFERGMDLWHITGVQRATARLIAGLEVEQRDSRLQVHFITNIPYFKVTERYNTEQATSNTRRDLRAGKTSAAARPVPGGVCVRSEWAAPHAGVLEEHYVAQAEGWLHVTSHLTIGGQTCSTLQVYRRQGCGVSSDDLRKDSDKRYGRASDILRNFGMRL